MKNKLVIFVFIAACLVLIGEGVMIYATTWGVGVSPDSIAYIKVARNLVAGEGLNISPGEPLTHYPPLYPMLLAASGFSVYDPLDGARWLQVFLFAANVLLVAAILFRETNGSLPAVIFGPLFMLVSLAMFDIHTMAWSESLFILLSLCGFLLLSEYLARSGNRILSVVSALFIGLAFITRYVGIAGVLTGCSVILLLHETKGSRKAGAVFAWGGVSVLPMLFWAGRNMMAADTITGRTFQFHPINWERINDALSTAGGWLLLPENLPKTANNIIVLLFFCFLVIGTIRQLRKQKKDKAQDQAIRISFFPVISILYGIVFFLVLTVSITFLDAHTPMDNRILSPLYPFGLITVFCLISNMQIKAGKPYFYGLFILFFAGFLFWHVKNIEPYWRYVNDNGRFYTGRQWQMSNAIRILRLLPDNIVIYSNGQDALEFLTGRNVISIPAMETPGTEKKNVNFADELQKMEETLASSNGLLVYLNLIDWRWYLPTSDYLSRNLPLQVKYQGPDGVIYQVKKAEKAPGDLP